MVGIKWKKCFSLSAFSLSHEKPITFILSQWQFDKTKPSIIYCVIRFCLFVTFFVSWVFSMVHEKTFDGSSKWAIYLTNWGYTVCTVQAFLVCMMILVSCISRKEQEVVLKIYPLYWLLNIIAVPMAFTITIIYWALIYKEENANLDLMNLLVHGCNSILMFLDLWIVSHPVKILHFLYPLSLALIYTLFTYIYFITGGVSKDGSRYIYPIIKWDKPGTTTMVCLAVMVLMICLHILSYGLFYIRITLYEWICAKRRQHTKSSPIGLTKCDNSITATETI